MTSSHERQRRPDEDVAWLMQRYAADMQAIALTHPESIAEATSDYYVAVERRRSAAYDSTNLPVLSDQLAQRIVDNNDIANGDLAVGLERHGRTFELIAQAQDPAVWESVQDSVARYGIGHNVTAMRLGHASSPAVTQAMKAALDRKVWESVQDSVARYGIGHNVTAMRLGHASSPAVTQAMKAALDGRLWEMIFAKAAQHGAESAITRMYLGHASSPGVESLMREKLQWEAPEYVRSEEDIAREALRNQRVRNPDHSTRPPGRERQAPDRDLMEVKRIIEQTIHGHKAAGWLRSEDVKNVMRVVATIKLLRQRAEEKGEVISDRAIYLRYRRSIENQAPSDKLKKSFAIVDALMGGTPKGSFKF